MSAIAGLRGTGDWGTDERPKNFREMILWRSPNGTAPLTALLSKIKSESVDDPEFAWWEEELNGFRALVNYSTGFISTSNTLTIDTGDGLELVAGDLLLAEAAITSSYAHEIMMVSSVTSATVIVVQRGFGGTTNAALVDDQALTKIGNVYEEGSTSPAAATRNPTKLYNYLQIFKTAYRITNSAKATRARTGDALKNDKKRKMFDHSAMMEMAFFFGKRYEGTGAGGKPLRTTMGILQNLATYASSRITAFTTTPTESTFLNAVYPIWDYNTEAGSERIAFCGNGALNSLNKLANAGTNHRITHEGSIKVYGMNLQKWIFPQGELFLRTHPLFNTHARFTNDLVILDPTALKYRYLTGRDTKMEDNIQANDADEQKGQWIGEVGLEMEHAKTSAWLSNVVVS